MHKNIVLSDDLEEDYLRDLTLFVQEWESQSKSISVVTSGSTGSPKRLNLRKKKVIASAKATGAFFGFKENDTLLLNLSPNYIAGKLMIVRGLIHNMKIVVAPNSRNPLENLEPADYDFGAFVPYQLTAILENEASREAYQRIRNVIIGGAPMTPALEDQVKQFSNSTYATFGMTETITHFALRNISEGEETFQCLPGVSVATDSRGCLVVNKNAVNSKLVTNDVVELIGENRFHWKGRIDFVVNSGGIKLYPEELERKLAPYLPDNRFYFGGRPSERFGEELVLYIEGQPENWIETAQHMNSTWDKYKQPKAVIFQAEFDETPTGKIIRQKN